MKTRWIQTAKENRGSALILVMMFVLIFSFVIAAIMVDVAQETRQTHRSRVVLNSLEGAKASLNSVSNNILYLAKTRPPTQLGGVIENLNDIVHQVDMTKPNNMDWVEGPGGQILTYVRDRGPNDFEYAEITDPNDPWYGYSTAKLDWEVVSYLREDSNSADLLGFDGMGVRQRVTVDYIPFYQFAIFYDNELELHPGPTMDVRGRTHSNVDMYLAASSGLKFWEKVTCAGKIFRMLENESGSAQTGPVEFRVPRPNSTQYDWKNMKNPPSPHNGDQWFDHRDVESWYQGALDRWREQVLDQAHGINSIRPPLPAGAEMYDMLRRASPSDAPELKAVKMEYQAAIIITGDPGDPSTFRMYSQVVDDDGNRTLTLLPQSQTNSVVGQGLFYDGHQQTVVRTLDIDLGALANINSIDWADSTGIVYVSTTPNPDYDSYTLADGNKDPIPVLDANGEVIFDDTSKAPLVTFAGWMTDGMSNYMPAVRVTNASYVPRNANNGFGLYTDRPVYTAGHINTVSKATAVIGGDSVTVTSTEQWLAELDLGKNDSTDAQNDGIPDTSADRTKTILATANPDYPSGATRARGYTRNMGNNWRASQYNWDQNKWWNNPVGDITNNVIFLMGNTPSTWKDGIAGGEGDRGTNSGGAHNVMRYLEYWNKKHTLNGSMIVLFGSPIAMHKFRCCDKKGYYSPPTRDYKWDAALRTSEPPPGMPVFIDVKLHPMEPISKEYAISNLPSN